MTEPTFLTNGQVADPKWETIIPLVKLIDQIESELERLNLDIIVSSYNDDNDSLHYKGKTVLLKSVKATMESHLAMFRTDLDKIYLYPNHAKG